MPQIDSAELEFHMQAATSLTQSYHIICEDGHEYQFEAIDDSHALGLSEKQYPKMKWKLYRVSNGQKVIICGQAPGCPPPSSDSEAPNTVGF